MKVLNWVVPSLLILATVAPNGRADTVYTYTGSVDTFCSGTYAAIGSTCAGQHSLSMTIDTPLTCVDCTLGVSWLPHIASFAIVDGAGLSLTSLTAGMDMSAATDKHGRITAWWLYAESDSSDPYYQTYTSNVAVHNIPFSFSYDYSDTFSGQNRDSGAYLHAGEGASQSAGSWTEETSPGTGTFTIHTPEPGSLALILLAGLIGFVTRLVRRRA